jgi:hypothetical protein
MLTWKRLQPDFDLSGTIYPNRKRRKFDERSVGARVEKSNDETCGKIKFLF